MVNGFFVLFLWHKYQWYHERDSKQICGHNGLFPYLCGMGVDLLFHRCGIAGDSSILVGSVAVYGCGHNPVGCLPFSGRARVRLAADTAFGGERHCLAVCGYGRHHVGPAVCQQQPGGNCRFVYGRMDYVA